MVMENVRCIVVIQVITVSLTSAHNENNSVPHDADSGSADGESSIRHSFARLVRSIEAAAFWSAIALPFLYLPLLFYGLETRQQGIVFFSLLALNLVALLIGHRYKSE